MEILLALVVLLLAAAAICLWLTGSLFGRVLAFLIVAPVFGLFGAAVPGGLDHLNPIGLLAGIVLAWCVASAPAWHWHYRTRQLWAIGSGRH